MFYESFVSYSVKGISTKIWKFGVWGKLGFCGQSKLFPHNFTHLLYCFWLCLHLPNSQNSNFKFCNCKFWGKEYWEGTKSHCTNAETGGSQRREASPVPSHTNCTQSWSFVTPLHVDFHTQIKSCSFIHLSNFHLHWYSKIWIGFFKNH